MATKNINATLNMMDGGGNLNVVYLVTKKENITDLTTMTGASSSAAGDEGLVPAPAAGDQAKYLKGDGTWGTPTNTTYSPASASANGLMSSTDKAKLDGIAAGANKYTHPAYTAKTSGLYKVTIDATGHVSAVAAVSASDLASFGLTATAAELNYTDGVTSNIQSQLNAKAATASPSLTGTPKAPTASAGTNTTQIATTAFVTTAINNVLSASNAMVFKGTIGTGGTVTALPASHQVGDVYVVKTAGTYAGAVCEIGDMILCVSTGTAAKDSDWTVIQTNINGAVTGPTSAVTNRVAIFDGATGQVIKDSGFTIAASVPSGAKFTDTTYSAMTGASSSAAGKTGLVPAPAAGKQTSFLRGDGTWVIPTNTTYSNATTSKAGLMSAADKSRLDALPNTYISAAQPSALKAGDLWIQPVE